MICVFNYEKVMIIRLNPCDPFLNNHKGLRLQICTSFVIMILSLF